MWLPLTLLHNNKSPINNSNNNVPGIRAIDMMKTMVGGVDVRLLLSMEVAEVEAVMTAVVREVTMRLEVVEIMKPEVVVVMRLEEEPGEVVLEVALKEEGVSFVVVVEEEAAIVVVAVVMAGDISMNNKSRSATSLHEFSSLQ
jgi:hypothetical protein